MDLVESCRLCSAEQKNYLSIFSPEGLSLGISAVVAKHFHLRVSKIFQTLPFGLNEH